MGVVSIFSGSMSRSAWVIVCRNKFSCSKSIVLAVVVVVVMEVFVYLFTFLIRVLLFGCVENGSLGCWELGTGSVVSLERTGSDRIDLEI